MKLVERLSDSWWCWLMRWVAPSECEWVQLALRLQEESTAWLVVKSVSEMDSMGTTKRMSTISQTKQTVTAQDGKQR
jgi:hypothetical protein